MAKKKKEDSAKKASSGEKEGKQGRKIPVTPLVLGATGVLALVLLGAGTVWGINKLRSRDEDSEEESTQDEENSDEGDSSASSDSAQDEGSGQGGEEEGESDGNNEEEDEEGQDEEDEEDGEGEDEDSSTDSSQEGSGEEGEDVEGETTTGVWAWIANDYLCGEIQGESYDVRWGDTLWEISEGKYCNGFKWTTIKDANLDKVGYLPDGTRALIFPGQVLGLP